MDYDKWKELPFEQRFAITRELEDKLVMMWTHERMRRVKQECQKDLCSHRHHTQQRVKREL